jgi:hypothetical protein
MVQEPVGMKVSCDTDGIPIIHGHKTLDQIQTLDELLKQANVDQSKWMVDRWKANCWNSYSNANGIVPLWQVNATLKRKELSCDDIHNIICESVKAFKLGWKPRKPLKQKSTDNLLILGLPDIHLGKLAWSEETGHGNWNTTIAKQVWEEAIDDLLDRSAKADELWLPLGNDFFNVDDNKQQTTAGTHQDEDGRWQKTFRLGVELAKWTIARCLRKYPKVHVIMVYGNHDRGRSWVLGELLTQVAPLLGNVTVDNQPLDRKYYQWHNTGIGFAHGDRLKEKDLAHLCSNEGRDIWGKTKRFELFLGHLHHTWFRHLGGVLVRTLDALCPPDDWHAKGGYVTSEKTASSFLYNATGMIDQKVHYPNPKNYEQ